MQLELLDLVSLFFFTLASAGFILFTFKYRRGSPIRNWGIRLCHLCGFLGVGFLRLSYGHFSESTLFIIASLTVSLLASEISSHFLAQEPKPRSGE